MTRRVLIAVALPALLVVSVATASPPPDKGKPPTQGPGCKPNVSVVLKGTLTSDPAAGATTFTMNVTGANAHGKSLKGLDVTILVSADTLVRRQGAKSVESLANGDRANVRIRRCKADLPLTTETVDDVAASRVVAQAAKL
jgi:hypothetical protein